ncbi:MAG TPA: hypothetical protein VHM90_11880 [Phycisphaerae bacterium]|nr:hypothetical protein [Phycisphaerae bacterium]
MAIELLGWASSLVLLLTICKQIHKQWQARTSVGVSKWLFIGQALASVGFALYSFLLHNWVFIVTNSLMACSATVGLVILIHQRRREGK